MIEESPESLRILAARHRERARRAATFAGTCLHEAAAAELETRADELEREQLAQRFNALEEAMDIL